MENYIKEFHFFVDKTSELDYTKGGDKYMEYHRYILESLNLISEFFMPEAHLWYQSSINCMNRTISLTEAKRIQSEIKSYRVNILGGTNHMPDVKNQAEALTFLFQFAVEHPDDDEYRLYTKGISLIQAVEEYAFFYIEFFGHGKELVELVRSCFMTKDQ